MLSKRLTKEQNDQNNLKSYFKIKSINDKLGSYFIGTRYTYQGEIECLRHIRKISFLPT